MLKVLTVLLTIAYAMSLQCTDEFQSIYKNVITDSTIAKAVCHACPANCLECLSDNLCLQCKDGYYLFSSSDLRVGIYCKENRTSEKDNCKLYQQ